MWNRSKSFRSKIMNYNLMLIVVMVLVCTTYVLINDRTIKKFNSTYTTYNELNQFYDNLKNLNDALQVYLYSPDDQNYKDFHRYRTVLQGNVEKVKASLKNQDHVWRFELLNNMVDGYMAQAELVIASDLQQEKEFSAKYQELLYEYDLINKTASEYYGLATQDMQLQKAAVNSNQKTMQLVSLFFILYLIVWMIYISISTIKSITDPLEKVINNMNRIKKGAYDLTQISNTNKEMNVLCLALEDMADSIEKNIQYENEKARLERRVLEQQNDNLRKDELLAQSELRILQNQINPHFLYNMLFSIRCAVEVGKSSQASQMLSAFIDLLRSTLDVKDTMVPLCDELETTRKYLVVQKLRYGEKINYEIEMQEGTEHCLVPPLILQPLVENAIFHGIEAKNEAGTVVIESALLGENLQITISDDGAGMDDGTLVRVRESYMQREVKDAHSIGMSNVHNRIRVNFGEAYGLTIESALGIGTTVTLLMPSKS